MGESRYSTETLSAFDNERRKNTIEAATVRNKVYWVNPQFTHLPFDVRVGNETPMAFFYTQNPQQDLEEGKQIVHIRPPADDISRSGSMAPVIFEDGSHQSYRFVDFKGMGVVELDRVLGKHNVTAVRDMDVGCVYPAGEARPKFGLLFSGAAEKDAALSDYFMDHGLRTIRTIALVNLEEFIAPDGEAVSIDKARQLGILHKSQQPVIQIRAWPTLERLNSLNLLSDARKEKSFLDAKALVSAELGKELSAFSNDDYLAWFATTLGEQVALLYNMGYVHRQLHNQNITLDCRLVDLPTMLSFKEAEEARYKVAGLIESDTNASESVACLVLDVSQIDKRQRSATHYRELFNSSYLKSRTKILMDDKTLPTREIVKKQFPETHEAII